MITKFLFSLLLMKLVSAQIVPCDGVENKLSISWSPRVISRDVKYNMKFHYEGKTIRTLKVRVCFTVWLEEMLDDPIYHNCDVHHCSDAETFGKELFPPQVLQSYCPLEISSTGKVIEYTKHLDKVFSPIDGDYVFHANATSPSTAELYFCVNGKVSMLE